MQPIHDADVLLLLATALAAKRRPAPALDIVAAIDLLQGTLPSEQKLVEAFARLGQHGLLTGGDEGVALTAAAEKIIETLPRKGETDERLYELRQSLGAYPGLPNQPPVEVSEDGLRAAIVAHRAAAQGPGKNLLVPKPKTDEKSRQRPGQRQRKPAPTRRRQP